MKHRLGNRSLILIALSNAWCADVLAHGEGECLTGVFSGDKSKDYIKVLSHPDTENSNHRHEEGYYNSLGVLQNRWFAESNWSEGMMIIIADARLGSLPVNDHSKARLRQPRRHPVTLMTIDIHTNGISTNRRILDSLYYPEPRRQ